MVCPSLETLCHVTVCRPVSVMVTGTVRVLSSAVGVPVVAGAPEGDTTFRAIAFANSAIGVSEKVKVTESIASVTVSPAAGVAEDKASCAAAGRDPRAVRAAVRATRAIRVVSCRREDVRFMSFQFEGQVKVVKTPSWVPGPRSAQTPTCPAKTAWK
jgi:hypothetical protein